MDVTVNAKNISVSDGLERQITEKLSRLNRYLPNIANVTVDFEQQKSNSGPDLVSAQITVRHSRGAILRAEERMPYEDRSTLQATLNGAIDKMYRRISRFKGKRRDRRDSTPRYFATQEELDLAEDFPEEVTFPEIPDAEQQEPRVFRRKAVSVAPMTEEEAIAQMELLGHNFFMFFHAERNRVNVLYRRGADGYGVLDPQDRKSVV